METFSETDPMSEPSKGILADWAGMEADISKFNLVNAESFPAGFENVYPSKS